MNPKNPLNPDDTRTHETDFAAVWSSDGVTRSLDPTATGLPADLPFLFSAGQHFGPYLVVRPIGKGGMGQVYEAEETDSGRRVAIKILGRGIGDDEERERFIREGQLAASLSHPNCVYVFGTSEIQGFPVIAMELAPAGTLKELVVPGSPMPMATAVDAILQVIAGLDAAAAIGILHRDIKPSNCFVDRDGRVMVGDFGLSMTTLARDDKTLTVAGTILGTPGFASPEQLRGDALDVRSDIYSVGATLYYLLTGRQPFDDPNIMTLLTRVATEQAPSLVAARPDLPGRLGSVVAKCLAKKPGDRHATYAALAAALEPFRSADIRPAPLGRRFLAGWIDIYASVLPMTPLNLYLGATLTTGIGTRAMMLATIPRIAIVFLYYAILEGRFGWSVGKLMFNLRVVDAARTTPGFRRAALRAAIFIVPSNLLNMALLYYTVPRAGFDPRLSTSASMFVAGISILLGVLLFAAMFSTARRRNGWAGLHDLGSATRVVLRPRAIAAREAGIRSSSAASRPQGSERFGPYLVPAGARASAPTLAEPLIVSAYDDRLHRGVWLELLPAGTAALPASRRDLGRPARTRWLSGRRASEECWDAYEAVDGMPLTEAIRTPQPWSRVRHWLADLSSEVAAGLKDDSLPPLAVDRIWIGSDDRARLLDFVPPNLEPQTANIGHRLSDIGSAQQFLYSVAMAALRGISPDAAAADPPLVPLPLPARELLLNLREGKLTSADALARDSDTLLRTAAEVSRGRRAIQLALSAVIIIVMPIAIVGALRMQLQARTSDPGSFMLNAATGRLDTLDKKIRQKPIAKDVAERDALEAYISARLREAVDESGEYARAFPAVSSTTKTYARAARAIQNHPHATPEEVQQGDAAAEAVKQGQTASLMMMTTPLRVWILTAFMIALASCFVGALAVIGALAVRGFTFRGFGAALVIRTGEEASRLRALWRTLVIWSPAVAVLMLMRVTPSMSKMTVRHAAMLTAPLVILAAGTAWAIFRPARGIQDRLAGTWIVPR